MGKLTKYGEDISNDSFKIMRDAFKDMIQRRDEWNNKTGLEPAFVRLPEPDSNAYVTCGVTGGRMEEMEKRFLNYTKTHGVEPNYITPLPPTTPSPPPKQHSIKVLKKP